MGGFGLGHLLLLGIIVFLFFGRGRMRQMGRSLGEAVKGFKEGLNDSPADYREVKEISDEEAASKAHSKDHHATRKESP